MRAKQNIPVELHSIEVIHDCDEAMRLIREVVSPSTAASQHILQLLEQLVADERALPLRSLQTGDMLFCLPGKYLDNEAYEAGEPIPPSYFVVKPDGVRRIY
jgi:hypothetical protein